MGILQSIDRCPLSKMSQWPRQLYFQNNCSVKENKGIGKAALFTSEPIMGWHITSFKQLILCAVPWPCQEIPIVFMQTSFGVCLLGLDSSQQDQVVFFLPSAWPAAWLLILFCAPLLPCTNIAVSAVVQGASLGS